MASHSQSLDMLLSGLKRHLKDPRFVGLCGTHDTVARQLHEAGVAATVNHTPAIEAVEQE